MGQSAYGNIWKKFWRDASGREHDPERVAGQAWKYLQSTGDVAAIETARHAGECSPWMRIVCLDPIVVLQIPCQHKRFADTGQLQFHGTQSALELSFVPDTEMYFDESLSWSSPDLKQAPTQLTFTDGVAEIPLANGKLILTQDGEWCKVRRE